MTLGDRADLAGLGQFAQAIDGKNAVEVPIRISVIVIAVVDLILIRWGRRIDRIHPMIIAGLFCFYSPMRQSG